MIKRSMSQRGNIFLALFGAVALVGVLGYGTSQFIRGPLTASTNVTRVNMAETQMMLSSQVAVLTSVQGASSGDCDADGTVEPLGYRSAGSNPHPTGGGYLPTSLGNTIDPWGTEYGYCVWDHGTLRLQVGCQTGGVDYRLGGGNVTNQPVIAVISAGKDKIFQTTCNAWVDANADLTPDTALVVKSSGSDDLVTKYTYAEANGMGAGLWALKSGDANTATINKDLEVAGGANFSGSLSFSSGGLVLPDQSVLATCNVSTVNQIRRNNTTTPPTLEICYNNSGTYEWAAISGSGGGGGGGSATPGGSDPQVQFSDGGNFAGDPSFIWDKNNNRLGLGATTPAATVDMGSSTGQKLLVGSSTTSRYGLGVNMSGATSEANLFAPSNGTTGHLSFGFVDNADGTTYSEKMRLTEGGYLGIGTGAPAAMLQVAGEMIIGNTSLTCSNSTEGAIRYNGSTDVLQFCNGTAWGDVDAAIGSATPAGSDGYIQYNNNGVQGASSSFIWDDTNNRLGIGRSAPVVSADVNGAVRVGTDTTTCSSTIKGAIRYNSTGNYLEFCNGTSWRSINYTSDSGTPPTATTGMGYFVLTATTWNGNLGGLSGANAKCLTELNTTYNWMGKTDANSRGLLTSANVKALLCDISSCQLPLPNTTYVFARANLTTIGGATFTSDSSGYGPNNAQFWSGTNYFGGALEYWTGFYDNDTYYNGVQDSNWRTMSDDDDCTRWTSTSSGVFAWNGSSNSGASERWLAGGNTCDKTLRLICMVHP